MQNHRAAWLRVSKRRLFGLGVLVALSLLLASGSAWAVSCAGSNACRNTDATIGEESCKGPNACRNNTGDPIEDGACLGKNSCRDNAGSIGDESCRGQGVCRSNLSSVGYKSCRGKDACKDNAAEVGDLSCAGKNACQESQGVIGNGSCRGKDACKGATADIGNGACIGARSCMNRSTPVGDGECRGKERCAEEASTCPCDFTTLTFDNWSAGLQLVETCPSPQDLTCTIADTITTDRAFIEAESTCTNDLIGIFWGVYGDACQVDGNVIAGQFHEYDDIATNNACIAALERARAEINSPPSCPE